MTAGSYYSEGDDLSPAAAAAGNGQLAGGAPAGLPAAAAGGSSNAGAASSSSSDAFARMRQAAAAGSAMRGGDPTLPLQLVWTTAAEVQHSREGWAGGGSIPGRHDNVMRPFLQRHYCRCVIVCYVTSRCI